MDENGKEITEMEEEKTCRNCEKLQKNGFCGLSSAREIEECIANSLMHWSSVSNPQFAFNLDEIDNL